MHFLYLHLCKSTYMNYLYILLYVYYRNLHIIQKMEMNAIPFSSFHNLGMYCISPMHVLDMSSQHHVVDEKKEHDENVQLSCIKRENAVCISLTELNEHGDNVDEKSDKIDSQVMPDLVPTTTIATTHVHGCCIIS